LKKEQVIIFNGLILIILGLFGYIIADTDKKSLTAFIGPATGVILLLLSIPVKKEKILAEYITLIFTIIITIAFFYIGIKRLNTLIILSAVVSLLALFYQIVNIPGAKRKQK
jgi:hypothetical protein